jgi:hypothetical protein
VSDTGCCSFGIAGGSTNRRLIEPAATQLSDRGVPSIAPLRNQHALHRCRHPDHECSARFLGWKAPDAILSRSGLSVEARSVDGRRHTGAPFPRATTSWCPQVNAGGRSRAATKMKLAYRFVSMTTVFIAQPHRRHVTTLADHDSGRPASSPRPARYQLEKCSSVVATTGADGTQPLHSTHRHQLQLVEHSCSARRVDRRVGSM